MFSISGRVVDPVNSPLPPTTVKLNSVAIGAPTYVVLTDDDGRFVFPSVASQSYELRFDAPGFLSRRLRVPKAAIGHDVDIGSVVLEIGEMTEGPVVPAKRTKKAKRVTVCEALADPKKFSGKPAAIVGRVDCENSRIDRVCFLAEDHCDQAATTGAYTWPNKVLIVDY